MQDVCKYPSTERSVARVPDPFLPFSSKPCMVCYAMPVDIQEQFVQIDIYVFDQILRGNITREMRVLDAGCGYGRNLVYLLREGCEIFALDASSEGVDHVRSLSASLETGLPPKTSRSTPWSRCPSPTPSWTLPSASPCFTLRGMKITSGPCSRRGSASSGREACSSAA